MEAGDQVLIRTDREGCTPFDGMVGIVSKAYEGEILHGKVMKEPEEDMWIVEVYREEVKGHHTLHSLYGWELTEVKDG